MGSDFKIGLATATLPHPLYMLTKRLSPLLLFTTTAFTRISATSTLPTAVRLLHSSPAIKLGTSQSRAMTNPADFAKVRHIFSLLSIINKADDPSPPLQGKPESEWRGERSSIPTSPPPALTHPPTHSSTLEGAVQDSA